MKHFDKLIQDELRTRGIDLGIEEVEIVKNSVSCKGIRIIHPDHPQIAPVVYYSAEETLEDLISRILEASERENPDYIPEMLKDPRFIAEHLILGVSRRNGEESDVIKKQYLNFDLIMRVELTVSEDSDETMSSKVTVPMLKMAGLQEADAWDIAIANTKRTANIRNLADIFSFLGLESEESQAAMYVASCNQGRDGAAVLFYPEVFRDFCETRGLTRLYILPSSTQEAVVFPWADHFQVNDLAQMVFEINQAEVDPLIQMDPAVYVYQLSDNSISVAKTLEKEVQ